MSKTALIYSRVSTDEQAKSGYSLRDQEAELRKYCALHGIRVAAHFCDDASAKSFARPEWIKLFAYAETARPDLVLFVKWDRFTRDAGEGYRVIKALGKIGVTAQATTQPIDASIPEQLPMLALYLSMPEAENARRSLNVKAGMRRAKMEGRYVAKAPLGYRSDRGADGKRIIVPCEKNGPLVRRAFQMVAERANLSLEEIRRRMKTEGLRVSNSQFVRMLGRSVYAGLIEVDAFQGDPARTVEGLHLPLANDVTWAAVQERFAPKKRSRLSVAREGQELRGHLICSVCGGRLTASTSKGNGGRYGYYHCSGRGPRAGAVSMTLPSTKGHDRYRTDAAGDAWLSALRGVQVAPGVRAAMSYLLELRGKEDADSLRAQCRSVRAKIEAVQEKQGRAAEALVEGVLPRPAYARLSEKYDGEVTALRVQFARLESSGASADVIAYSLRIFGDLSGVWTRAKPESRAALVGSIWPAGIAFDGERYRTGFDSPLIRLFRGEMPQYTEDADGQMPPTSYEVDLMGHSSNQKRQDRPASWVPPAALASMGRLYELRGRLSA